MGNSNLLFESVFNRKLSAVDTRDYLVQITNEYPYFPPAQFFLLLKLEKATNAYQQQAAKTAVFFNNPYWLQFQLQETREGPDELSNIDIKADNQSARQVDQEIIEIVEKPGNNKEDSVEHPETPGIVEVINKSLIPAEVHALERQEILPEIISEKEAIPIITDIVAIPVTSVEPGPGKLTVPNQEDTAGDTHPGTDVALVHSAQPIITQQEIEENSILTTAVDPVNNETPPWNIPENKVEAVDITPSTHFNNDSSPLVNESETADDLISEEGLEPLRFKLNIDTSLTTENRLIFEPLHTTDYFASLGIKLGAEIKPADKLGKQLKSFTEWLKTMKKIHSDEPLQRGPEDLTIQKLAEKSNREDAVVTEAMAEVLIQQGKTGKAVEVYKKLSLLNPSKSAYFAAKIEQLKED